MRFPEDERLRKVKLKMDLFGPELLDIGNHEKIGNGIK